MRLVATTLTAVLLSGCSWMGVGGGKSSSYGYGNSGYGYGNGSYGCEQGQNNGGYGQGGCAGPVPYGQGGYGVAGNGYGAGAYGPGGFGVGTGALGLRGVQGAGANLGGAGMYGQGMVPYGAVGLGAGGNTLLPGTAPYGSAVGGATQFASAGQYGNTGGQWVNGQWVAGSSTTIQGAPIYVPQPYPAYYGVAAGGGCCAGGSGYGYGYGGGFRGASAALPFGLEAGIGTELGIGGDIVGAKPAGIATGGTLNVSATPAISYKDAYKNAIGYDLATTYDISPSTTVLARIGYSKADGERLLTGTIDDGTTTEDLYAQWGDLEQITLEGGMRQYMGGWNNRMSGVRPYIGATAGFTHNNSVNLSQDSATLMPVGSNVQPYLDAGWTPTASGVIGAEMQVGPRTAIGVETGIRWRDNIGSNVQAQETRWSVPLQIRGRVSF